jgi:hypothetical protein
MKRISFLVSVILICLFSVETMAQRDVTTTTRKVSSFDAITVSGGIDLYITQGLTQSVKIETVADKQDDIAVTAQNGVLHIYDDSHFRFNWGKKTLKAHVTLPTLTNLKASGGSDVYNNGILKFDDLKITTSGGSDIKLDLNGARLECKATGGADLKLRGKVTYLDASVSGGSDLIAYDLVAVKAKVSAHGGSDAKISVTGELEASAFGGADIYYKGNPSRVNKHASGGSDITRKE